MDFDEWEEIWGKPEYDEFREREEQTKQNIKYNKSKQSD